MHKLNIFVHKHSNGVIFDAEMLPMIIKLRKDYGNVFKIYIGYNNPRIFLNDPKAVEFILSSTTLIEKSDVYDVFHSWLGTGLLTSGGQKWKKHRRMLTPAFHFNILEQFIAVFNKFSMELIERLENESTKSSIDIMSHVTLCSLDVICATSLGTIVNAQKNADSAYISGVLSICELYLEKLLSPMKSNGLFYLFTADCYRENTIVNKLHKYTNAVIASRRKEIEKSADITAEENDEGIKKRLSFLDLMLQRQMLKNDITNEEIRQEVDTFTFEGHDTTSSGIGFTLYCLSAHPDVQVATFSILYDYFRHSKSRTFRKNSTSKNAPFMSAHKIQRESIIPNSKYGVKCC